MVFGSRVHACAFLVQIFGSHILSACNFNRLVTFQRVVVDVGELLTLESCLRCRSRDEMDIFRRKVS